MERPKLMKLVKKAMEKHKEILNDLVSLWQLFLRLSAHKRVQSLILVIDAVDECDLTAQEWLVSRLDDLLRGETGTHIKVLITSRPNQPAVSFLAQCHSMTSRLSLECRRDILSDDVKIFITKKVETLVKTGRCMERDGHDLADALLENAEATFLWVSLAIALLWKRRLLKRSDIGTIVRDLPEELTRMYDALLDAIPCEDRTRAYRTLCMIGTCQRQLTIGELNSLLVINERHESVVEVEHEPLFPNMRQVEIVLSGLVTISDSRVALVHHSLKEHLIARPSISKTITSIGEPITRTLDHEMVAESCMRYLLLEDFEGDLITSTSPTSTSSSACTTPSGSSSLHESDPEDCIGTLFMEPTEKMAETAQSVGLKYPVFDYAALYWPVHFSQVSSGIVPTSLLLLARRLYEMAPHSSWFRYVSAMELESDSHPRDPDALTLSCFLGHANMTSIFVAESVEIADSPALYWAARNGHAGCVGVLLDRSTSGVSWSSVQGYSPLAIATSRGHTQCVEQLLQKRVFSINEQGRGGRTPLALAAGCKRTETMALILRQKELVPELVDHTGATPIFWAVWANSVAAVRLLMRDTRVRQDHLDVHQRSALSWACEYGFADTVALLVNSKWTGTDTGDDRGRTPLMYAAISGCLEAVTSLVGRGRVDVSRLDKEGRNALSFAAQQADPRVLEYLLAKDPSGVNQRDRNGWTPFAWTLDPPERLANAATLLPHLPPSFWHDESLDMFFLSVNWESFDVAGLLILHTSFPTNKATAAGRTALSYAAERGHLGLVRQLLSREGVDKSFCDITGMTPYSMAARAGHVDVCNLLSGES